MAPTRKRDLINSVPGLRERLVDTAPAEDVTSRDGHPEVDPRDVGMRRADVESIWDAVVTLYETGLHPAIALCLRRNGEVVIDRAIGHARGNAPDDPPGAEKVLATPKTLFNIFSASKAVTAMVVHLLNERGLVHLDDPVVEQIPEFGAHGKEKITWRHILTHRSGIPTVPSEHMDPSLLADTRQIVDLLCRAEPMYAPGRRIAYHALTGGFIIGEMVERVTGKDIRTFLRTEMLDPLGIETMDYGVPVERLGEVALNAHTGPPVRPPLSWIFKRAIGASIEDAVVLSNAPEVLTSVVPSGNIIGTAEEVCRFWEMLLRDGELGGARVLEPRTVRRAIAEQSYREFDFTLALPIRYGMGFMLGGDHISPYGPDTGKAFGHIGFTYVLAWADPDRDVSACLMTTGKPLISWRAWRWYNVVYRIATLCPRLTES